MFCYVRRKDNPLVILSAGYSDFTGQFDSSVYEQVQADSLPEGAAFEVIKTKAQLISEGRAAMLVQYQSAPITLRSLFYKTITEINGLLDLQDFTLALQEAQAVDTSIVTDTTLKAQADALKASFVTSLTQLTSLT